MKMYGPYLRKDNRMHMTIVNDDGTHTSLSYPKYLMEQHLGRKLEDWETVDHINEDCTNNDLSNLRILSRSENAKSWRSKHRCAKIVQLTCKTCHITFEKREASELYDRNVRNNDGPFCSRRCSGLVHYKHKK